MRRLITPQVSATNQNDFYPAIMAKLRFPKIGEWRNAGVFAEA